MKRILLVSALLPLLANAGCSHMSSTDKGVLTGGAIGATTGALIGSTTKHTGAGAVIGGAVGALTGGLIGNSVDEAKAAEARAEAAAAHVQGPLSLQDVAQMARNHFSDGVIISKIRSSGTVYNLSVSDIDYLKSNGVSDAVVMDMNATASRVPRRVYRETVVQPVYVAPPPPVSLGIGMRIR